MDCIEKGRGLTLEMELVMAGGFEYHLFRCQLLQFAKPISK